MITDLTSIYTLTPDQICKGTSMSAERSQKFHEVLHESLKKCSDATFLNLFNLDGVADKSLKELTSLYSLQEILDLNLEDCIKILKKAKGTSFHTSKEKLKEHILAVLSIKNS